MMTVQIIIGDCREILDTLPEQSVHCVVTSPPFWGLRDYGLPPLVWGGDAECGHVWGEQGPAHHPGQVSQSNVGNPHAAAQGQTAGSSQWCQHCGAWRGSLGLEPTPELYVEHLVGIFRQVRRVLRDDGTVWLNLGDTYSRNPQKGDNLGWGKHAEWITDELPFHARPCPETLHAKNLIGIPWRVAFALQADGWWLRSDIIWQKPNCMPESVKDRPTCSHEYLFLLAKAQRYFYDADAVREPQAEESIARAERADWRLKPGWADAYFGNPPNGLAQQSQRDTTVGRNKRSVWTIATCPFPGAHFATFPPALVEPCIKAGTSERGCCPDCGAPWERVVERAFVPQDDVSLDKGIRGAMNQKPLDASNTWEGYPRGTTQTTTIGWRPTCSCYDALYRRDLPRTQSARKRHQQDAQDAWFPRAQQRPGLDAWDTVPAVVLDFFGGAGTTGLVADQLGRDCILIELKGEYGEMAQERILSDLGPMFTRVEVVTGD